MAINTSEWFIREQKTTAELEMQVYITRGAYNQAKQDLAERLLEEFPAKAGDIVRHPRLGDYKIDRIIPRWDGPTVYVQKKTNTGWHRTVIVVADLAEAITKGIAIVLPKEN